MHLPSSSSALAIFTHPSTGIGRHHITACAAAVCLASSIALLAPDSAAAETAVCSAPLDSVLQTSEQLTGCAAQADFGSASLAADTGDGAAVALANIYASSASLNTGVDGRSIAEGHSGGAAAAINTGNGRALSTAGTQGRAFALTLGEENFASTTAINGSWSFSVAGPGGFVSIGPEGAFCGAGLSFGADIISGNGCFSDGITTWTLRPNQ
ncbi:MAG: DUF6764 family protein [Mycobacteriaceae bacterium]